MTTTSKTIEERLTHLEAEVKRLSKIEDQFKRTQAALLHLSGVYLKVFSEKDENS
jgi:hypothetical protein